MFGQDAQLVLARELVVLGDEVAAMGQVQPAAPAGDLDRLADQREGHGVAIGLEADEVVLGDPPRLARLEAEPRLAGGGNQVGALPGKPVRGPLVGRAVHPHVGDLGLPLAELLAQILFVDEGPPRQEVALEVLHPRFHFAFGLRPIGPTEVRLEAPVVGELLEGGVPDDPPLAGRVADGPRPIVEMLAGVAPEVLEGPLVGVQKLTERLAHAGLVEAAAGVAERQDERMQDDRPAAEVNARLPPVDLALLARRGLKTHRRSLRRLLRRPQGPHEAFHRLIAPPVAPLAAQLLEQDPRRVLHRRRPAPQIGGVVGEQGIGPLGARVGLPGVRLQDAADRLPIQLQLPGDLRFRPPLDMVQPVHLPPAILPDHAPLPE